ILSLTASSLIFFFFYSSATHLDLHSFPTRRSSDLEAGVMRELHWHATATEWAFVLKGRVRTTVINPAGQTETNDCCANTAFENRSEEHTSELQSPYDLVCRLLLEKKKKNKKKKKKK